MIQSANTPFSLDKFRVVKHVTLPQLKLETGKPVYVKITGKIFKSAAPELKKDAQGNEIPAKMAPPELVHIDNLESGIPQQMIVNTVLGKELQDKYPSDGYVGKMFEIIMVSLQGKQYKGFQVTEIAPVEEENQEAAAKTAKK